MDLGQALHPLYQAIASLLAYCYALVPNYAVAIALLTLIVMVVLSPLTLKSTRSMLAMQRLQPEMKKLQTKYKGDRQKLNEEMMKFYKENKINPLGGCLPLILQLPVFFILYSVIRGLTTTVAHPFVAGSPAVAGTGAPKYISSNTQLWHDLHVAGGQMVSFGVDLSKSATSVHGGFFTALPFYLIIIFAIALQYLQLRQLSARNPAAAAANPQMQRIQKFMPLFFSIIYIGIPAAVNIYFIVSSLARIGQQELMFRYDPQVREHAAKEKPIDRAREKRPIDVKEVKPGSSSKKPSGQAGRRDAGAKTGGDGKGDARRGGRQQRARAGDGSPAVQSNAIEAGATNGSESADGAKSEDGAKAGDGTRSRAGRRPSGSGGRGSGGGAKSADGSRADWSKAPRQKPSSRSQSKRARRSR
ncbi:MAG TPA: YidC/Oxa1 family membrane protein insertase [Acidimicrobiales bacterium]|nr:YidC/Oxa1 family membrane protein insertase [Acidimicrobiales bacterium]